MRKSTIKQELVEADVLCIGGGIAGLMAAIRASELGAKVVVAEKGNSLRSGNAATGIDHIRCYIPEIHGHDVEAMTRVLQQSQHGGEGFRQKNFMRTWMEKSFDIVKLWERWGIPMKYKGNYDFQGHTLSGQLNMVLHFSGQDLKKTLTREATKSGAGILNRVMVFEVLGDDSIIGALGISTREDKIIQFKAKSVIMGTGPCTRLYPGPTPGWMCNLRMSPSCTGDGRAMAYRVGAELVNVELPVLRCGPKYFARAGKGTWAGVVRDPQGTPIGPFVTKPDAKAGDAVVDYYQSVFRDYANTGKGPLYMDCRGISEEDLDYMMYFLEQEGNTGLINYLKAEGIDIRKNPVEFMTYNDFLFRGGIYFNERGETSIRGLYAAGDESFGGGSAAAVFGWIAGEHAARYAHAASPPDIEKARTTIEEKSTLLNALRGRHTGAHWKEANLALQQIMGDHAGSVRSETLLTAGLGYLRTLKEKAHSTLLAHNPHELMRCLEVLNLLDVGELVFIAANERKETRGHHVRTDYPLTNPLMQQLLIIRKRGEEPVIEWRAVQS
jgi:succinate dehydrogenase/fumarate reductase flavoprotein subunit